MANHDFPVPRIEGLLHRLYGPLRFRRRFRQYGAGAFVSPFATVTGMEAIAIGPGSSVGRRSLLTVTPDPAGADSRIDIGRHTYIGRGCTLSACGSVRIGDEVTFGDNVYLSAGQHGFAEPGTRVLEQPMMAGQVAVGNGAWIGFGAFISSTARLEIGAGAIVMANAVVTRSVPPLTMVGGVPAMPVKRFDSERRQWVRVTGPEQRS